MKKYFYLAAVSAMMLTACSSENDVVQPTTQPTTPQVVAQQQAVAFDTYLSGTTASTRAGDPTGVMTTEKLKTEDKGFGVFAFYHDNCTYATEAAVDHIPDFMFNEHVKWNNGWGYSPLKYWPNETLNDSQDPAAVMPGSATPGTNIDKLSFFAYAPYVDLSVSDPGTGTMTVNASTSATEPAYVGSGETSGILSYTKQDRQDDPLVEYGVSSNPDNNVDLLWGVAPAGFSYTNVSGTTTSVPVGMPLKDLVKPDKDQKVKFLFQHALSRIGLSVVSAIDQIAAGDDGNKYKTDETRVLIEEVKIWGTFGKKGVLNLNNGTANVANWIEASVDRTASTEGSPLSTINATNGYLAPDLRYDAAQITTIAGNAAAFTGLKEGVLASEKPLMVGGPDPSKKVESSTPAYSTGTVLYHKVSNDYVVAKVAPTTDVNVFVADGDNWKQVGKTGANTVMDGSKSYYNITATQVAAAGTAADGVKYYTKTGDESTGDAVYTLRITGTIAGEAITTSDYTIAEGAALAGSAYASDTYYTGLLPRYFMVIPSKLDPTKEATTINVKITYRVVTKDTKLSGNVSNVQNAITKQTSIQLENGKSYNLKLILGLTSVKLDATVADWLVADDSEIWLPKNVD